MDYYHDVITRKSWEELKRLKRMSDFILIGGWAVYLYTRMLKSKDIDIIIQYDQLRILKKYYDIVKNERLQKYEARRNELQIDIYLPHYSNLGIRVENLFKETKLRDGYTVIDPNYLCALKLFTLTKRGRSPKGRKDFLDIISLFSCKSCEAETVRSILKTQNIASAWTNFGDFLNESDKIPELSLNTHQFSKLKKSIMT